MTAAARFDSLPESAVADLLLLRHAADPAGYPSAGHGAAFDHAQELARRGWLAPHATAPATLAITPAGRAELARLEGATR